MAGKRLIIAFVVHFAALPATTLATVMRFVPFDEKVENAAAIVIGSCVANESRWDEARVRILTYSTISVEKSLKGARGSQITVVLPGGEVGDVGQYFVGVPRLQVGRRYVLFIRNSQAGPTILYLQQGVYPIATDDTGQSHALPADENAVMIDTQRGHAQAAERRRSLPEFEQAVVHAIKTRDMPRMQMRQRERSGRELTRSLGENALLVAMIVLSVLFAVWRFMRR